MTMTKETEKQRLNREANAVHHAHPEAIRASDASREAHALQGEPGNTNQPVRKTADHATIASSYAFQAVKEGDIPRAKLWADHGEKLLELARTQAGV